MTTKTALKSLFVKSPFTGPSAAVAAAALLAFALTFGGPKAVRAEDPISPPAEEMVLVPLQKVQTLEQRVAYLEEQVASLTESWQHIDTHRICVADDGGAETCLTKAQLDLLLAVSAKAEASQELKQAPAPQQAASEPADSPASEAPVVVAATAENSAAPSEPAPVVEENPQPQSDPDTTGTVPQQAITGAAIVSFPHVEIYEEPASTSDNTASDN